MYIHRNTNMDLYLTTPYETICMTRSGIECTWWGLSGGESCTLNFISTIVLLSLSLSLCWWIIRSQGCHSPSSRCFCTDI